jgi:hypothetical protein
MSSPLDYPDWNQPVAQSYRQATLYSANLVKGNGTPVLDVSQYQSVIVFANS